MARPSLTGSRLRRYRVDRGLKQADLARACDISPSYLNLIEHNRRRIGGALLNRLARALEVDPAVLSEGAERALTGALERISATRGDADALEPAEDFAGAFPAWARLVEEQGKEREALERAVEVLNDRLTHDPMLSASLHDVLSTVTAIRSTSGILASGEEIEPEWRARFHRNLYEDSQRLAQSAEALVGYLDAGGEATGRTTLPQEELEEWLARQGWRVEALERGEDVDDVLAGAQSLESPAARDMARSYLARYARDAVRIPKALLSDALVEGVRDPTALASRFGVSLDVVMRRLATMPEDAFVGGLAPGLLICDGSGTLTFRKPVQGFEPPRFGSGCPLWPLYQALARPMQPIRADVVLTGRDERRFALHAIAEWRHPAGYDYPAVVEATMLVMPVIGATEAASPALAVGTSCRVCTQRQCPARREPSILSLPGNRADE